MGALAKVFLEEQKTELIEIIKFDPEADMFCVYSSNPDALKSFIIAFKETCENETLIQDLSEAYYKLAIKQPHFKCGYFIDKSYLTLSIFVQIYYFCIFKNVGVEFRHLQ
nr:Imm51 family immunity protein [Histophilus somni]